MNLHFFKDSFLNEIVTDKLRFSLNQFHENDLYKINNLEKLSNHPIIHKYFFNEKFLKKISSNLKLDDFIFLNRVGIQKNKFKYDQTGDWHQDSGSSLQNEIISKTGNFYFKIGIYLQENNETYGGGIDLLRPFFFDDLKANNKIKIFLRKVYYFFKIRFGKNILKTKKGDIVGFSGLVFHRTTPLKTKNKIKSDRYSIYFLLGNKNIYTDIIKLYEKKNNIKINLKDHIIKLNLNKCNIRYCSGFLTKIVEQTISD